ncbi:salivary glue protein Sgs-5-like [Drosophila miranda]|uniref:salivary glue protein Sgs-5-like n=1 Tax=Drosophila miranda TaxID=7229 RepID=UPI0007E87975|nr:salivary glue protein Sgs-5-like [Drosophila miranda]
MGICRLSFLLVLLGGLQHLSDAQTRGCARTCNVFFRCSPYYKELVWAVVDGVCRVYQNGCIFGNENCTRVNQCLTPMNATSPEKCKEYCPRRCPSDGQEVCGWFPYINNMGVNSDRYISFPNRCLLDQYSCQNDIAYAYDPTLGPCP